LNHAIGLVTLIDQINEKSNRIYSDYVDISFLLSNGHPDFYAIKGMKLFSIHNFIIPKKMIRFEFPKFNL